MTKRRRGEWLGSSAEGRIAQLSDAVHRIAQCLGALRFRSSPHVDVLGPGTFRTLADCERDCLAFPPPRGCERICELLAELRNLVSPKSIAQYGSVPGTGAHCEHSVRSAVVGAGPVTSRETNVKSRECVLNALI